MNYEFKIYETKWKDKLEVASGEGKNKEEVEKECMHYVMMYSQDGPIEVWRNYDEDE